MNRRRVARSKQKKQRLTEQRLYSRAVAMLPDFRADAHHFSQCDGDHSRTRSRALLHASPSANPLKAAPTKFSARSSGKGGLSGNI
jgi:hypothetical protein